MNRLIIKNNALRLSLSKQGPTGPAGADGAEVFATVVEATTARTLGLTDAKKYIRLTHASGCAITVPAQASVTWVADTEIIFRMAAAGVPTFPTVSGVTINNRETAADFEQHATFALKRVAENVWDLI